MVLVGPLAGCLDETGAIKSEPYPAFLDGTNKVEPWDPLLAPWWGPIASYTILEETNWQFDARFGDGHPRLGAYSASYRRSPENPNLSLALWRIQYHGLHSVSDEDARPQLVNVFTTEEPWFNESAFESSRLPVAYFLNGTTGRSVGHLYLTDGWRSHARDQGNLLLPHTLQAAMFLLLRPSGAPLALDPASGEQTKWARYWFEPENKGTAAACDAFRATSDRPPGPTQFYVCVDAAGAATEAVETHEDTYWRFRMVEASAPVPASVPATASVERPATRPWKPVSIGGQAFYIPPVGDPDWLEPIAKGMSGSVTFRPYLQRHSAAFLSLISESEQLADPNASVEVWDRLIQVSDGRDSFFGIVTTRRLGQSLTHHWADPVRGGEVREIVGTPDFATLSTGLVPLAAIESALLTAQDGPVTTRAFYVGGEPVSPATAAWTIKTECRPHILASALTGQLLIEKLETSASKPVAADCGGQTQGPAPSPPRGHAAGAEPGEILRGET